MIAILYGAAMIINLEWPRVALYVDDTYKWGPIVATFVLVGFGLIYYYAVQQHKSGVLEEHRAEAAAVTDRAGWAGDAPALPAMTAHG